MDELMMFLILDGILVVGVGLLGRALFHAAWRSITSGGKKSKRNPKGAAFLTGKASFLMLPIPVGYVLLYGFDTWGFLLTLGMVFPELISSCTHMLETGLTKVEEKQEESIKTLKKENEMLKRNTSSKPQKPRIVRRKRKAQAPPNEIIWD